MRFTDELGWRGLIQDKMPGLEELLDKGMVAGYIGFDPTADSLHIGNLIPVMLLTYFQQSGHKPIVLVGGATGMVGDPSGKSQERQLLPVEEIEKNVQSIQKQLEQFLDFDCGENSAIVVNNMDWFKDFTFLDFIRDVGKHISINYMMAKDSVKSRLETGMSFTEFCYQLIQGYDFLWLYKNENCKVQMGGSDQWGNITTGVELVRRKEREEVFGLTAPLVKKADGSKFGKSEGGNIWLDAEKTSPYKFYQFWFNTTDEDVITLVKYFSLQTKSEIEKAIEDHLKAPHERMVQKNLAEEMTLRVHGKEGLTAAVEASEILFGKSTAASLKSISEQNFLEVFEGVPQAEIDKLLFEKGIDVIDVLSEATGFLKSKGEARRALNENSISINKDKVGEDKVLTSSDLINGKYLLLQRGKKNYFLAKAV